MELNTRGRYAVTAMADLAKHGADGALALSMIAGRQQTSLAYLEQLFLKLRRAGLVESARGRLGGYRLSRPASAITVAEIMAAVEEDIRMTRCADPAIATSIVPAANSSADSGISIRTLLLDNSTVLPIDPAPTDTVRTAIGMMIIRI